MTDADLAKLDTIASEQGLSRSAAMRRLIEHASPGDLADLSWPSVDELHRRLVALARAGSVSAVTALLARYEDGRLDLASDRWDADLDRLLQGDD